uniref:Protease n=1 Tax=viral metagenome TaxID=1070528 RepID=A0A6C0KCJ9_9ZZZZ
MSKPFYHSSKTGQVKKRHAPKDEVDVDQLQQLKALMAGPRDNADKEKNHIFFYSDVDQNTCLDLNRKINDLNKELLKYAIDYDCEPPNIYLHINSNGGCLLSALSTVDAIKNSRIPIISIVEGCAASAATVISMVCQKRFITPNSFMLIHQLSTGVYGKYEEIKDDFINDTKFMERMYALYREHTDMNDTKIKAVMSRDIWWDMEECVDNGLVDGVWDSNMTSLHIKNLFQGKKFETNTHVSMGEKSSKKRRITKSK